MERFEKIGPSTPLLTLKRINELYWALGDATFAERAALQALVFSPDNRNVGMIKRLAEVNIVSGDTKAADKYLRLLDKTAVYHSWALAAPHNPFMPLKGDGEPQGYPSHKRQCPRDNDGTPRQQSA